MSVERLDHPQHRAEQAQQRPKVADDVQVLDPAELLGRLLADRGLHRFLHAR